jgi:hypothetical protein
MRRRRSRKRARYRVIPFEQPFHSVLFDLPVDPYIRLFQLAIPVHQTGRSKRTEWKGCSNGMTLCVSPVQG